MADLSPDKLNRPYPQQLDADFEPITWQAFLEWVKRHHSETLNSLLTDYLRWKQSN